MEKYVLARFRRDYKIFTKGQYLQFPRFMFTGQAKTKMLWDEINLLVKTKVLEIITK